jgi:hypothetical protein
MLPYTIDDQIQDPSKSTVEITIDFGNGHKRWCFFITPQQQLALNGSWVEGTKVRMLFGSFAYDSSQRIDRNCY